MYIVLKYILSDVPVPDPTVPPGVFLLRPVVTAGRSRLLFLVNKSQVLLLLLYNLKFKSNPEKLFNPGESFQVTK